MKPPRAPQRGLAVRDLQLAIVGEGGTRQVLDGVSFALRGNECLVLLGESGCGKSLTALALMRLLPPGIALRGGAAELDGEDLFALPERAMRRLRGDRLAMIFQEPQTSLNPVLSIGQQIEEALASHRDLAGRPARAEAARLLAAVGLPEERLDAYPFQLSGGQRQRALIAMMLAGDPSVLIADEPTTALDVTVQAQILALLNRLRRERGMGLLLITHDLDVARDMADRVVVMYAGQVVETLPRAALDGAAFHPYTRCLLRVLPALERRGRPLEQIPGTVPAPGTQPAGCRFASRCPEALAHCHETPPAWREIAPGHGVRCHLQAPAPTPDAAADAVTESGHAAMPVLELAGLRVHFPIRRGLLQRVVGQARAVDGVDLRIGRGETLALVGESGCGKSTLARAALRLIEPTAGQIRLAGEDIGGLRGEALRRRRTDMQIVFQDPYSSLNPRMRLADILEEGLLALRPELDRPARRQRVASLLERVGLPSDAGERYPHEFSGGQRQRLAIARALAVEPKLLICDEPTSALDVSVQAQILNLLAELRREQGLAYLFITHNLPVVAYLAHRVAVMYQGRILEEGPTAELITAPSHPYTRLLLASAPGRGAPAVAEGGAGGDWSRGCAFVGRCPEARPDCRERTPAWVDLGAGRRVYCLARGG